MTTTMSSKNVLMRWSSGELETNSKIDEAIEDIEGAIDRIVNNIDGPNKTAGSVDYQNIANQAKQYRVAQKKPYLKLGLIGEDVYLRLKIELFQNKSEEHVDDLLVIRGLKSGKLKEAISYANQ